MKQLPVTEKITSIMNKVLGEGGFDENKYAVFETVGINTLPLNKAGVYDKAVLTASMINEMAAYVNKETVPLHLLHQQRGELPSGRLVQGKVTKRAGRGGKEITDLNVMFYMSNGTPKGAELIDGINSAIINEVSVGVYPKSVKCSKCDFNYMTDGSFINWLDATCGNDHKVGDKGTHVILDGLDKFMEMSLVSLGAADHARIKNKSQSVFSSDINDQDYQRLAASDNIENPLAILIATSGQEPNIMKLTAAQITELREDFKTRGAAALAAKHADVTATFAKVTDELTMEEAAAIRAEFDESLKKFVPAAADPVKTPEKIELSLDALVEAKTAQKTAETSLAASQTELTKVNAELAEFKKKEAELTAAKADADAAKEFLKLSCQALLTASGSANTTIPEGTSDLINLIKTSQAKLSKLPVGGLGFTPEMIAAMQKTNGVNPDVYSVRK